MNIVETFIIVVFAVFVIGIAYAHFQKDEINDKDTEK